MKQSRNLVLHSFIVLAACVPTPGALGQWITSSGNTFISNSSARVGIGLNTPIYPLQVRTTGFTYSAFIQNSQNDSAAIFGYGSAIGGDVKGVWGYSEAPFGTGVLGQAVSGSGAAVGVRGLSSAIGGFGGYFEGGRFGLFSTHTHPGGYAAFLEGTTYISANLGIGTTNPFSKVHVYGFAAPAELRLETNAGAGNSALTFAHATNRVPYVGIDFSESNDSLRIRSNVAASALNTTAMAVKRTSGKVGFQTEDPKARLHIGVENAGGGYRNWMVEGLFTEDDTDCMYIGLKSEGGNRKDSIIAFGDDTSDNLRFLFAPSGSPTSTAVTEFMRITGLGRVGIGNTNPQCSLEVTGGIRARGGLPGASGISNNGFAFTGNSGDNDSGMFSTADGTIIFCIDSVEASRFTPDRNMGIGFTPISTNRLAVNGNIFGTSSSSGVKAFQIDHPLDPLNMYLMHSSVESPDMMNIYNGNVITDARGYATVTLPSYFGVLNTDFRYQLTVIDETDDGAWVMVKVAREIVDNEFVIRSSSPNVKVSWQVTGVRKDPLAMQKRIRPEVLKEPEARGRYLFPEAYGQPVERGIMHVPVRTVDPDVSQFGSD